MAKTDDEIIAAVLAECERLLNGDVKIARINTYSFVEWIFKDHYKIWFLGKVVITVTPDMTVTGAMAAYRLLGLEARDVALEARCQHEDTRQLLKDALFREQSERARAAKLVAALDEFMKLRVSVTQNTIQETIRVSKMGQIALAEWKGGQCE